MWDNKLTFWESRYSFITCGTIYLAATFCNVQLINASNSQTPGYKINSVAAQRSSVQVAKGEAT